ncbi:iron-containing alcohol dehydrogenase, partial [Enterococcus faecalis]|uniref:iron-containing alcohol dehydrogenase n=1 Tax=Enterococcus faecalis TaxID=1351 RepID=UPI003CC59218
KISLQYQQKMENVDRVMLVCDPGMVQFCYADIVRKELQKRINDVKIEVFSDDEPNPSTNTVYAGTKMMVDFQPDTVIA